MIKQKGQSIIEYAIVFSAITFAILLAAYSALQPAIQTLFEKIAQRIKVEAEKLVERD